MRVCHSPKKYVGLSPICKVRNMTYGKIPDYTAGIGSRTLGPADQCESLA
jgi:hypothetical protein